MTTIDPRMDNGVPRCRTCTGPLPCKHTRCEDVRRLEARVNRLVALKERLDKAGVPVDELAELVWYSLEEFIMSRIGPLVKQYLSGVLAEEIRCQLSRMQVFIPDGDEP